MRLTSTFLRSAVAATLLVGLLAPGWETAEVLVRPGDNLCAYTDGLIERRQDTLDEHMDRLLGGLESAPPGPAGYRVAS